MVKKKTALQTLVAKGEFVRELSLSNQSKVISSLVYESEQFQVVLTYRSKGKALTEEGFYEYCEANKEVKDPVEEMAQTIAADLFKMIEPEFIQVQITRAFNEAVRSEAVAQKEAVANKGA